MAPFVSPSSASALETFSASHDVGCRSPAPDQLNELRISASPPIGFGQSVVKRTSSTHFSVARSPIVESSKNPYLTRPSLPTRRKSFASPERYSTRPRPCVRHVSSLPF